MLRSAPIDGGNLLHDVGTVVGGTALVGLPTWAGVACSDH